MNPQPIYVSSIARKLLGLAALALVFTGYSGFAQSLPAPVASFDFDSQTDTTSGTAAFSSNTPSGTGSSLNLSTGAAGYADESASVGSINGLGAFTVSLWINLQASPSANDRLLSSLSSSLGIDLRISTNKSATISASSFSLTLQVNGASASSTAYTTNYRDVSANNQWVFIAATYDGTNARFFDGGATTGATSSALGQGIIPLTGGTAGIVGTSSSFYIGATPATVNDRTPPALIDSVNIYSSVLSDTQIEQVRLNGISAIPEPANIASLMAALALMAGLAVRRRKSAV
jgi:hypothetical protein